MLSLTDAQRAVLDRVKPLGVERVQLLDACGRVLADDMTAGWDMPLNDNSAMDGYAVVAADCVPGASLPIVGYIPAGGRPDADVTPGTCIKIMTGAPMPAGADAVIPVEETDERDGVMIPRAAIQQGQHIRYRGEDVAAGAVAVAAGTVISPAEISMLASFGRLFVPVYRKPRVAIVSTGDELMEPGETPRPGSIINSNSMSLAAAVREAGGEPVLLGIARDNHESHREKFTAGLQADVLITSAGVSAGDRDFVRDVLEELGAEQHFWKVAMKPGGPTAFATWQGKPVFSLPGNPVSTMITFEQFVRPALLRMGGRRRTFRPTVVGVLREQVKKKPGKLHFLRVRIEREGDEMALYVSGDQNTGILTTMLRADAIAMLAPERTVFEPGEKLSVQVLREDAVMGE